MFEASLPGVREYSLLNRTACLGVKFLEYSLAGMFCGFLGQGVANAMMLAKWVPASFLALQNCPKALLLKWLHTGSGSLATSFGRRSFARTCGLFAAVIYCMMVNMSKCGGLETGKSAGELTTIHAHALGMYSVTLSSALPPIIPWLFPGDSSLTCTVSMVT